jgi:hypothetical protein
LINTSTPLSAALLNIPSLPPWSALSALLVRLLNGEELNVDYGADIRAFSADNLPLHSTYSTYYDTPQARTL